MRAMNERRSAAQAARQEARGVAQEPASPVGQRGAGFSGELVELARRSRESGRAALRVASPHAKGRIFSANGYIIHAEFGEDFGLRAVVEMLRSARVRVEPFSGAWPRRPSLHLGPELLGSL